MKGGLVFSKVSALILLLSLSGQTYVKAGVLDDPTRPPGYPLYRPGGKVKQGPSWHVNAIYISATEKKAMINGRIVRTGEKVSGAEVAQILPTEVRMRKNKQQFVIQLNRTLVKKTYRND